ncbi:MAG: T9SS type A sorting domain-containing protein [Candidatus Delongbacteria bacterium]
MLKRSLLLLSSALLIAPLAWSTCLESSPHEWLQGRQFNHAAIPASRSNPASALDEVPDNQFFSLGFYPQGHLTLALEQPAATGLITIWETTWRNGSYCLETAAVEVAAHEGGPWVLVGVADNDRGAGADFHLNEFSFDAAALGFCVQYVRLSETSDLTEIAQRCNTGDGFDVDAVCVSGTACPDPGEVEAHETPAAVQLRGNWPNPFNPVTRVHFSLSETGPARLEVFDLTGRRVATLVDGLRAAGEHQATFDASRLPSGIYLARLQAGNQQECRKMTLLK